VRIPPLAILAGTGAALATVLILQRLRVGSGGGGGKGGRGLVLYAGAGDAAGTFAAVGRRLGGLIGEAVPVTSRGSLENALRQRAGLNLTKVVLVGHGNTQTFFRGLMTIAPEELGRLIGPVIGRQAVIGLAGCRSAADPDEPDWSPSAYQAGGARSYAAKLRDELAVRGAGAMTDVRGHSATGHTTNNPSGRLFRVADRGRVGAAAITLVYGVDAYAHPELRTAFQGGPAERWIAGLA
jgi:hypothetical protein